MTKVEFLKQLGGLLETERALTPTDHLDDFQGWDSMGQVSMVSFFDEALNLRLPSGALQKCTTVGDLLSLVEAKLDA